MGLFTLAGAVALAPCALAQDGAVEAPVLSGHVQITSRDQFVKAGEAYFSPDGAWIVFQAVPVPPEGKAPDSFYAMYVARLVRDSSGMPTGMEAPIRVSPEGSANTCGWFHPTEPGVVIFGSTIVAPGEDQRSGFQRGNNRYVWMFPKEMEVVRAVVPAMRGEAGGVEVSPVFSRPEYDAECSYTADGRQILYAHVREDRGEKADADLWVYDVETGRQRPLITAAGYDGGPFFSPDGRWLTYRSDRRGNDLLQIFIAELTVEDGLVAGVQREIALTDNEHVNWCPFWHPSGEFVVYATSEVGHTNYEVFALETRPEVPLAERRRVRVTNAAGADVLPAFSADGRLMMWTAQRGPAAEGESRPSSQLWIAKFDPSTLFGPAGEAALVGE